MLYSVRTVRTILLFILFVDMFHLKLDRLPNMTVLSLSTHTEQSTYIGHIFSATATATNELVDFMEVNGGAYEFSPLNRLESCEIGINAPVGMFTQVHHRTAHHTTHVSQHLVSYYIFEIKLLCATIRI
jgi:hypothetical protein